MKNVYFLTCILLLCSCRGGVKGEFEVFEDMALKRKGKEIPIPAGTHEAKIKPKSKKKIKFKVYGINKNKNFTIRLPKGKKFPKENGRFTLTSEQIKQPYDLSGNVATAKTLSEEKKGYESCSYSRPYRYCTGDGRYGDYHCRTRYRTMYGQRFVRYKLETSVRNIRIEFMAPDSDAIKGTFSSEDSWNKRLYSHVGGCFY